MRTLILPGGERLLVGSIALARTDAQTTIIAAIFVALLLLLPVVPIVSGLQERYLNKQIRDISRAAAAFADGDLTSRIDVSGKANECAALAGDLNRTFDRLQFLVQDLVFVTDALAHELRSPLTRLRAELEKLRGSESGRAKSLDRIGSEIDGMLRTINATLELSSAEAEGASSFEQVDVSKLVQELWEVFEPSAEQHGISLVLGPCDECESMGNRDLLAQAISNLLDNALRYSRATRVELGCTREQSHCLVAVSDNGIGIPEENRGEALRKFGRLDRSRTSPGSGLGLTFVEVIASLHGGKLALHDNRPGLRAIISVAEKPR